MAPPEGPDGRVAPRCALHAVAPSSDRVGRGGRVGGVAVGRRAVAHLVIVIIVTVIIVIVIVVTITIIIIVILVIVILVMLVISYTSL